MDVAANEPVRLPPSPDGMDRSDAPVDKQVEVVTALVEGRIVINVNNVKSYGMKPHLLGDSLGSDDNDEGVSHGVEMPFAREPCSMEVDAPSAASTGAGPVSAPAEDDFYNVAGRAPRSSRSRSRVGGLFARSRSGRRLRSESKLRSSFVRLRSRPLA